MSYQLTIKNNKTGEVIVDENCTVIIGGFATNKRAGTFAQAETNDLHDVVAAYVTCGNAREHIADDVRQQYPQFDLLVAIAEIYLRKHRQKERTMKKKLPELFKKADLQDGMVVRYKNGKLRMVCTLQDDTRILVHPTEGWGFLRDYRESLTNANNLDDLDIVEVWSRNRITIAALDLSTTAGRTLLWKREAL